MNHIGRAWMAASGAIVNNKGQKVKSSINSLNHGTKRFISSGSDAADLRPLSGALSMDIEGFVASNGGDERPARQADDYLRQVMYLNCWGQS